MKTEFEKDNSDRIIIKDKIIPVGKREFEYQAESSSMVMKIEAYCNGGRGSLPYLNDEQDAVLKYQLEISKHTSTHISVLLRKIYKHGKGENEVFEIGFGFAEFVNKIFSNSKPGYYEGNHY